MTNPDGPIVCMILFLEKHPQGKLTKELRFGTTCKYLPSDPQKKLTATWNRLGCAFRCSIWPRPIHRCNKLIISKLCLKQQKLTMCAFTRTTNAATSGYPLNRCEYRLQTICCYACTLCSYTVKPHPHMKACWHAQHHAQTHTVGAMAL